MKFCKHSSNVIVRVFNVSDRFFQVFFKWSQLFFWVFLRWRNIRLEFSLKVICRRCMFRGESEKFILNKYWWKLSQFIMVLFLELYQFFFLFLKTFIRWINISLGFSIKVICIIWMFRVDGKHLALKGSWWKNINSSWCSFLNSISYSSCFSKL